MGEIVLIVDDEPHVCLLMSRALSNAGIETITANGGAEAIKKSDGCFPNVLVTDLNMPDIDGLMLCDMMETKYKRKLGLIILMTARTNKEIRAMADSRGNMEFLEKPISPRKLIERINRHFSTGTDGQ